MRQYMLPATVFSFKHALIADGNSPAIADFPIVELFMGKFDGEFLIVHLVALENEISSLFIRPGRLEIGLVMGHVVRQELFRHIHSQFLCISGESHEIPPVESL